MQKNKINILSQSLFPGVSSKKKILLQKKARLQIISNYSKIQLNKDFFKFGKSYFDDHNNKLGYQKYIDDKRYDQNVNDLIKKFKLNKDIRIIDFGCAKGTILSSFKRNNFNNLFGFDTSKYAITKANKFIRNRLFLSENFYSLSNKYETFCFSKEVLPHMSVIQNIKFFEKLNKLQGKKYLEIHCPTLNQDLYLYQRFDPTQKTIMIKNEWIEFIEKYLIGDLYVYFKKLF